MKISVKQLRHVIREELTRSFLSEASQEDQQAFRKIMSMITNTLGQDNEATQDVQDILMQAIKAKVDKNLKSGNLITMKSLAQ